jgi:DNA-binding transcriptional MocR family regulator
MNYRPSGHRASEIAADVEAAVASGRAPAGSLLPAVRALAAELGVAPGTVAAAYRQLTERGVVEGHRRAGTRIRALPAMPAARMPAVPPGTRDLTRGNPDPALLPPLPTVHHEHRLYTGAQVLPELGEVARAALAADGIELPALAVTAGAVEALALALSTQVRPGQRVAVEDPCYTGLLDLLAVLGLAPEPVAIDDEGMDPDGLARALARGAQAVVITPRAQNPFGAALSEPRARALDEVLATAGDRLVIEDDHAGPVAGAPAAWLAAPGRRLIVRSASKALGPDLRLAVAAGDQATVAAMEARQAVGAGWVSYLLQRTVAALLRDPATPAVLEQAAMTYAGRREALTGALRDAGFSPHAASGMNVWVPVADEAAVLAGMAARGWALAGGARFRIRTAPAVRVTISTLDPADAVALASDLAESVGVQRPGRSG